MPPAAPAAKPGLDLKRLPPWAWGIAIAGGAVVGFVFLKRKPGAGDEGGEGADGGAGGQGQTEGAVVTQPLSDDFLRGLGLQGHDTGHTGGGAGGGDSGDSSDGASSASLIYPNASGYYDFSSLAQPSPTQTTYQGGAVGATQPPPTYIGGQIGAGVTPGPVVGGTPTGGGTGGGKVYAV